MLRLVSRHESAAAKPMIRQSCGRVPVARGACSRIALPAVAILMLLPMLSLAPASSAAGMSGASPGQLVEKYTTANSDTYQLRNGHMLTHVYARPVNYRDAAGRWRPLSEAPTGTTAEGLGSPLASPALSPETERNPLGQENEAACTLTSTAPTTSACNELTFKAGYESSSKATRRALIQFVLPDLHEEMILLDAQLELYVAATTTSTGAAMGAYRVTTPWTAAATWNTSYGTTPWQTPGGDYANPEKESDAAINSAVGTKTGWTYWHPTRMVQEWYNGVDAPSGQGQQDLGFLLKDVSEGATNNVVTFDGREEREHNPGLTLEWVQRGVGNSTKYTQVPIQLSSTQSLSVNPASGNLMIHSNDLQIASKGLEFDSARTWNSLANEAPGYGYGWIDRNARYVQVAASGNVAYTDSSGNTFPFIKEGSNFKTPSGIEATMCEAKSASPCPTSLPSGTTYQLIYSKTGERIDFGHKEAYEPFVYYYVVSIENSAGEKQTAKYTGSLEDPTSWVDTEKTEIAYTESEAKGYTKVTDVGNGHSTSYTEPEGEDGLYHLTEYTNEQKEKTTYRYGGESYLEGNLLTEITEPSGNITKLTYNSDYQITKIERISSGQKTGPITTYTYYALGEAPEPCTSIQKATVATSPEGKLTIYCSNVLDEVERTKEIEADKTPPVFREFEASAYRNPETGVTTLGFSEAEDPSLPDGEPGSGVAFYTYRYSINGGSFSTWQQTEFPEVQVSGLSVGESIAVEAYATDYAGNVSTTHSTSTKVEVESEEADKEEDPSLKEANQPTWEGTVMNDSEDDTEEAQPSVQLSEPIAPAFTKARYKIISRGTFRDKGGSLVVGMANPGVTFDVKTESGSWFYGMLYGHALKCGWVEKGHTEKTSSTISGACPATHYIDPSNFATLINCDSCNKSTETHFKAFKNAEGKLIETMIPVYGNVRPYDKTEEPHNRVGWISNVKNGQPASVGWRYITKSGKYAMVSTKQTGHVPHVWAFIEAKYLPAPNQEGICEGEPIVEEAKYKAKGHKNWPRICEYRGTK